jgi:hypothetical protein
MDPNKVAKFQYSRKRSILFSKHHLGRILGPVIQTNIGHKSGNRFLILESKTELHRDSKVGLKESNLNNFRPHFQDNRKVPKLTPRSPS